MNHTYQITGMTCEGCVTSVTKYLQSVKGVTSVAVDLSKSEAQIAMDHPISIGLFQEALPSKYRINESESSGIFTEANAHSKSKFQQLKPLFLIFMYLFGAAFLLNFKDGTLKDAMLDFMGLFFIVFSFFKLLDLKGFPESFRMYDPLAARIRVYGWIYPFIELALGILFLMRIEVSIALIITLIILGITTIGVTRSLLNKKAIRCACLGTALNLPMTEATFIENAVMLIMGVFMLFNGI